MTISARLKRLETAAKQEIPRDHDRGPKTLEEWLAEFEALGRKGMFDHEPDFPAALQSYREAIGQAKEGGDPPWTPPDDFMPAEAEDQRRHQWQDGDNWVRVDGEGNIIPAGVHGNGGLCRRRHRFPAVQEARDWLDGMLDRLGKGIRPFTEAEFQEMTGWLEANVKSLDAMPAPIEVGRRYQVPGLTFELGCKYKASASHVLSEMKQGPRHSSAGDVMEAVRKLRVRYGQVLAAPDADPGFGAPE